MKDAFVILESSREDKRLFRTHNLETITCMHQSNPEQLVDHGIIKNIDEAYEYCPWVTFRHDCSYIASQLLPTYVRYMYV